MGKGYGITALVLGILSILLIFILAGIILGPLAIIFGIIGVKKDDTKGLAIAGIITGTIGTILNLILLILIFIYLTEAGYRYVGPF